MLDALRFDCARDKGNSGDARAKSQYVAYPTS